MNKQEKPIEYSLKDAELFIKMMDQPPSPNAALKKAFEKRTAQKDKNGKQK